MKKSTYNAEQFKAYMKQVMNNAWAYVKELSMTMADAMKLAWKVFKLKMAMKTKEVKFTYTKVNGQLREAKGHLIDSLLPARKNAAGRKVKFGNMRYFDTDVNDWRSFAIANLVSVNI